MKKLVLCLALIMFGGCELNGIEQPRKKEIELRFQIGDVVDLKIGGQGQVIKIVGDRNQPYLIRIRTDDGTKKIWLDEFELEIK
jgi:hypothetical protein